MRSLLAVILSAALTACAVGPTYEVPDTKVPDRFAGANSTAYRADEVVPQFWTVFNDDALTSLIEDALGANHDLRIAAARLNEARALRLGAASDFAPVVNANGLSAKTRVSPTDLPNVPDNQRRFDYYEAGFDASWELDIFGGVRRGYEASNAAVGSALASLDDTFVTVTSEVARNYFELRGLQSRYEVAQRNADVQRDSLDLTQQRLDAGRGTDLDVARAKAQLSTTLATLPQLEAAIARAKYRLAVLTAREPGTTDERLEPRPLPDEPEFTPVGEPSDWLRRRPDVRRAERDLASSTALVGVAVADLFPHVSLTGRFGYNGLSSGAIGDADAEIYHYGPSISWGIFDIGHVKARISGARSGAQGALAKYEQTVLLALEDTEGALVNHSTARAREAALGDAAEASTVATKLARLRYEEGVSDFLQVLDAERTQLEAEDLLAQSRADSATSLVAVYKALGAGWQQVQSPYMPAGQ
ncbi:MAG TPA: efflux transporter outer membrane subunit [Steroidobacteraceae bacterium]|jgi:multidrug efflux system outer membrane protein|nr:efflux transporter outer membrane subunit [Steroidobacteraceae bacterium]